MRNTRSAVSMVELVVAILVSAVAIGPMLSLLSSSNRMSSTSTYETIAVHYVNEICDQLRRLGPDLAEIVADARAASGVSTASFASVVNSWPANALEFNDAVRVIPFEFAGVTLDARIALTPLQSNFTTRRISIQPLDVAGNTEFNTGNFWKMVVTVAWDDPMAPGDASKQVEMVMLLNDNI